MSRHVVAENGKRLAFFYARVSKTWDEHVHSFTHDKSERHNVLIKSWHERAQNTNGCNGISEQQPAVDSYEIRTRRSKLETHSTEVASEDTLIKKTVRMSCNAGFIETTPSPSHQKKRRKRDRNQENPMTEMRSVFTSLQIVKFQMPPISCVCPLSCQFRTSSCSGEPTQPSRAFP